LFQDTRKINVTISTHEHTRAPNGFRLVLGTNIVSSHLGLNETLALLDRLRSAIQDFAAREEKLVGEFRIRSAAETKAFEAVTQRQESRLAVAIADTETDFEIEKAKWQSKLEKRKARITQAHLVVTRQVREGVGGREERRKRKIQEGSTQAERDREAGLANAAATLADFKTKLAESREAFNPLEKEARSAFRGYGKFRRLLSPNRRWPEPDQTPDESQLLEELHRLPTAIRRELDGFKEFTLPGFFRFFPMWLFFVVLLLLFAFSPVLLRQAGLNSISRVGTGAVLAGAFAVALAIYLFGGHRAGPAAKMIARHLATARRLHDVCLEKAEARCRQEQERIQTEFENTSRRLNQQWKQIVREAVDTRGSRAQTADEKAARALRKNEQLGRAKLSLLERDHAGNVARLQQESEAQTGQLTAVHNAKMAKLNGEEQTRWQALAGEWKNCIQPIHETIRAANAAAEELFPGWQHPVWKQWTLPDEFKNAAKFGRVEVDAGKLAEATLKDKRLALPFPANFSVPLALKYPGQGSILFETARTGGEEAIAAINNIIFRLLSTHPPGKLSFTIFDPVGLGQNFAGLMHLADYEESHINSRIWTQTAQLEEKLAELNDHMEKVIQMYLRNEYETIAEYNAQAGSIAEKYHFLVIADFPVNFSDTAGRRLINIATSGARCGVFTLIHWDRRHTMPQGFVADELRKNCVCLVRGESDFRLAENQPAGTRLTLDAPPPPEFVTDFLHRVGEGGRDSNRVEVPFDQVAPPPAKLWTEETSQELTVPIGRSGATKLQRLEIGKGTRQHALIAGKTGSGKSTLFHVIITNLALWCSPEQVEFYLVDFKKGVEFKCYATRRLPHAKVVAIESDREFGLSVLERVDAELRRRGDLFRQLGVQDVAGYKKAGGTEPMPRALLIIDEFQEYFTEEDRVSQGAAVLLDRIVRQGRAFGIHVLLGSQTLGGAYTLARATIGQMVIRIALMCNEADAYLIMDQDNPAPRLLSRPGEGIYNDAAGSIEGNSPFQTVWLPEEVRDRALAAIRERADQSPNEYPGPFVFEGSAPADIKENIPLRASLQKKSVKAPVRSRIWLGAPNSIKGPTEAVFQRQSGSNLLVVGQSEEPALTILSVALVSLAAQYPRGAARFFLLDNTPPGFPQREFLERVIRVLPHEIVRVTQGDLPKTMGRLAADLKNRAEDEPSAKAPDTFFLIHGLQNFKKLRSEDEFGFSSGGSGSDAPPAAVLQNLISEGPGRGFHVVATCDTYNNVNRFLGRKTMSEFEMRVLFQMSAGDSASLIDAPNASTLGLHRALLYNDREGSIETFRPYALPGNDWIEDVARQFKRLFA
jgi:DNA segregation ATPase FtsK/SpoIIIE, S-DNA-T family